MGGPGSGKTYISKQLESHYNIPAFCLDDIFWDKNANRYGAKASGISRDKQLNKILQKERWIIEGVYYSWLFESFSKADVIVILNPPTFARTYRISNRFIKRKLGLIPSKKESCKDFLNLLKWNYTYDKLYLTRTLDFIKDFNGKLFYAKNYNQVLSILKSVS